MAILLHRNMSLSTNASTDGISERNAAEVLQKQQALKADPGYKAVESHMFPHTRRHRSAQFH